MNGIASLNVSYLEN